MQGMKTNHHIDVIVPSYNAHATLRQTLLSVAAQSIADEIDVLVADDCSPNGGYEAILAPLRPWLSVREMTLEEDVGPSLARQRALDATHNPYVVFLDSDDTLANPHSLQEMRQALEADAQLVMVSGDFFSAEENGSAVAFQTFRGDMTWLLGNMYRRSFLEENDIRFIAPRTSEDFGFNTKVRLIAGMERVLLYKQPAYCWFQLPESATHADPLHFAYDRNAEDFCETLLDALFLARRRGAPEKEIITSAVYGMMDYYRRVVESERLYPGAAEKNRAQGRRFYREIYREIAPEIPQKTYDAQLALLAERMEKTAPVESLPRLRQDFEAYLGGLSGEVRA